MDTGVAANPDAAAPDAMATAMDAMTSVDPDAGFAPDAELQTPASRPTQES